PLVRNAGAVFCGPYAPAPVGDYVAGVNHVLPTARTARFASALRVADFQKHIHVVTVGRDALAKLAPHVRAFAAVEGLETHGLTVEVRSWRGPCQGRPTGRPSGRTSRRSRATTRPRCRWPCG